MDGANSKWDPLFDNAQRSPLHGSGTVESGVKQFNRNGHKMNANRMIILRSAILGRDFDVLWAKVA